MCARGWLALALVAVVPPAGAEENIWSPDDDQFEPDTSCEVKAAAPGPEGTTVLGTSCNRLDGHEIGMLVALDEAGHLDRHPAATALNAVAERNRMWEVAQLLAAPGSGLVAIYGSRAEGAPVGESVHSPLSHRLVRYRPQGTIDEPFTKAFAALARARAGGSYVILDAAFDAQSRLVALVTGPSSGADGLRSEPVWALRLLPGGRSDGELQVDAAAGKLGLGYYEVLQAIPRADGGLWVTGRFEPKVRGWRSRIFALAFRGPKWELDPTFNDPFIAWQSKTEQEAEIRLAAAGPDGSLLCVGELGCSSGPCPNVYRLTRTGKLDPAFKPFAMPGSPPQSRSMFAEEFSAAPGGRWLLSYHRLPGVTPRWAAPGLVRLRPDGTPDAAYQKALGAGLSHASESGGWTNLLRALPDGRAIVAGRFDHVVGAPAGPVVRLGVEGSLDAAWHPKLETVLPPKQPEVSAKTSAFVPADGKDHYYSCTPRGGGTRQTFMYLGGRDVWGHRPSCAAHEGAGDMARPGCAWQHCDARVRQLLAAGATCAETPNNPLDLYRPRLPASSR